MTELCYASPSAQGFPTVRMRRLRRTPAIRSLLSTPLVSPKKLIWPLFVRKGNNVRVPIASLPKQNYLSPDMLCSEIEPVCQMGVTAFLLFPDLEDDVKSADGSYILRADGLIPQAIASIKKRFPGVTIFADIDLSEYTTHGHSGIIDETGTVLNDESLDIIARAAPILVSAGADGVAPSGMIDGQVSAIRDNLDRAGLPNGLIFSYSTKFASAFYDSFRMAVHNTPQNGNRRDCQIPIDSKNQALRESLLDEQEGADILMVKPALCYLDIIYALRQETSLPIGAYNVSGEYKLIWSAAQLDAGSPVKMAYESLTAIFRSGADVVISYWANQIKEVLSENE